MLNAFLSSPFFGVTLSIALYLVGVWLFKTSKGFFLFTPLFVAMMLGMFILHYCNIKYDDYKKGGDIIVFFLSPATIAFAIPLYKMVLILKRYWIRIILSIAAGSFLCLFAVYFTGHLFSISDTLIRTILPQAATTAIALPIATSIGGIAPITAYAVIFNAAIIYGAGEFCLKLARITNPVARGLALGTAGKVLGGARARMFGPVEAAMASIALIIASVVTAFVIPIFLRIMGMPF